MTRSVLTADVELSALPNQQQPHLPDQPFSYESRHDPTPISNPAKQQQHAALHAHLARHTQPHSSQQERACAKQIYRIMQAGGSVGPHAPSRQQQQQQHPQEQKSPPQGEHTRQRIDFPATSPGSPVLTPAPSLPPLGSYTAPPRDMRASIATTSAHHPLPALKHPYYLALQSYGQLGSQHGAFYRVVPNGAGSASAAVAGGAEFTRGPNPQSPGGVVFLLAPRYSPASAGSVEAPAHAAYAAALDPEVFEAASILVSVKKSHLATSALVPSTLSNRTTKESKRPKLSYDGVKAQAEPIKNSFSDCKPKEVRDYPALLKSETETTSSLAKPKVIQPPVAKERQNPEISKPVLTCPAVTAKDILGASTDARSVIKDFLVSQNVSLKRTSRDDDFDQAELAFARDGGIGIDDDEDEGFLSDLCSSSASTYSSAGSPQSSNGGRDSSGGRFARLHTPPSPFCVSAGSEFDVAACDSLGTMPARKDKSPLKQHQQHQQRKDRLPVCPKEVDMDQFRDTSAAQSITWSKGGPMNFPADTPMLDCLTKEETILCRTLRLFPSQYLKIKETVIGATFTRSPFRKKEVRMWFPIDVNKINKLYDWFLHLGWIPDTDEEWVRRSKVYRQAVAGAAAANRPLK
ncbi:Transcriptional adapter ada2 [Cladochytrium tenue]|nr:Transcriptional adapter ada2 [Cladochytrium tenue]